MRRIQLYICHDNRPETRPHSANKCEVFKTHYSTNETVSLIRQIWLSVRYVQFNKLKRNVKGKDDVEAI
jgi:hypothetical protein